MYTCIYAPISFGQPRPDVSEGLKLTMILPSSNRYYALNDRTINLLMKGKIVMLPFKIYYYYYLR